MAPGPVACARANWDEQEGSAVFGKTTYLLWLALFLGLPLLVLILFARRPLAKQRRALALTLLIALVGGWAWDWVAVSLGAWHFDAGSILGHCLLGLPVEEWLWITGTTVLFGSFTVLLEEKG
jgi:lycopene cyclase domain-containing protein